MGVRASRLSGVLSFRGDRHQQSTLLTPKGYVPVCVGLGDESKRFMIHTTLLGDEDLLELLCISAEEYGFRNQGVLKIPSDAKIFEERMLKKDRHKMLRVITA